MLPRGRSSARPVLRVAKSSAHATIRIQMPRLCNRSVTFAHPFVTRRETRRG
jgi:hypothetical protein